MTDEEIIQKIYEVIKLVDCMQYNPSVDFNYLRAKGAYNIIKNQIEHIEAENAALRERLKRAVEIPDYVFECINGKVERIFTEYLTVGELKYLEENGYSLTKEAAEARLAELKGEKNE